jgi:acetyl/propionyl-CoA carboxylase alpha subunit
VKATFDHDSQTFSIELTPEGKTYRVQVEDQTMDAQLLQANDGKLELLIDGRRVIAYVSYDHAKCWVTVNGRTLVLNKSTGGRKSRGGHHHAAGELTAPMPGQIRAVNVKEGETVTKGQTLLLLEAMKMEIRVQAPRDGVVKKLSVQQGQTVERDQILVEIEEA